MTAKRILIVEDDEVLRDGMRQILEQSNYKIFEISNGEKAMVMIENGAFDLVISNMNMPVVDGLQLLAFTKEKTKSRFVLMCERAGKVEARHAYQLGADEFLIKPFSRDELIRSVEMAFEAEQGRLRQVKDENFMQVPLEEFVTGSVLKVDLYLRLSLSKYIKIGTRGSKLPTDRIDNYQKKGLDWLYMRKEDFAYYVGFNMNLAGVALTEEKLEFAKKIRITKHAADNLSAQIYSSNIKKEHLEHASMVVMNAVELISSTPTTLQLLESMELSGSPASHAVAVSIWSCLLAKQLGWTGQTTYFKIAMCALFHDIGEREIPTEIKNKERHELSQSDKKILESHAIRGRDILQSVPGMPEDVALVAYQHHELMHGGGYPNNLKLEQIHPLARLIGLTDRFCELMKNAQKGEEMNFRFILDELAKNRQDFDPVFLKKLEQLIGETYLPISKAI